MVDVDTFLTTLYVMVDDFCHSHPQENEEARPTSFLCASEVITLAIFARWWRFSSERDFYRYAKDHPADAFPTLPDRSQFNRLVRFYTETSRRWPCTWRRSLRARSLPTRPWTPRRCPFATQAPRTRLACRTGRHRLVQQLGLVRGVQPCSPPWSLPASITGFCFGPASSADQPLAETSSP